MKNKIFRIQLKSMEWHIAKDISVLAAFSNGQEAKLTIDQLGAFANIGKAKLGDSDFVVSVIGNDLLIDKGTKNLLHITEIEVIDLDMPTVSAQDARYILDEIREASPLL